MVILFDKRVRYVKKVKNHYSKQMLHIIQYMPFLKLNMNPIKLFELICK